MVSVVFFFSAVL